MFLNIVLNNRSDIMKNNKLHTTNIFKTADPEALKKAVTRKIKKLIEKQIKNIC